MGVFVDVLNFRSFLCFLSSAIIAFALAACADPDERLPWPTADEDQMPTELVGHWKGPCLGYLDGGPGARYFEVFVNEDKSFSVNEYRFLNKGCNGYPNDMRDRSGEVSELEYLGQNTWKITANMIQPFALGDLLSAEALMTVSDNQIEIRPVCADLHDINGKIHIESDDFTDSPWTAHKVVAP